MDRRRFIALCLGSGLIGTGSLYYFNTDSNSSGTNFDLLDDDSHTYGFIRKEDELLLIALIPLFVSGAGASVRALNMPQIEQVIRNIDSVLRLLPQRSRDEFRQLLNLLTKKAGRILTAGVWDEWESASQEDIDSFLHTWRNSWLMLFQKAYQGLHQLVLGSYYAERASWQLIDYPGPPKLSP